VVTTIFWISDQKYKICIELSQEQGRCGRMVVGFTTTYAISA